MEIRFVKASGAGNDFVIIDNHDGRLTCDPAALAKAVCRRHTGIGADGLLLIEPSEKSDFRMMYYNADGSYGGMCGNGGRCIARFAHLSGLTGPRTRFEALGYVYEAEIVGKKVTLKMKPPSAYKSGLRIQTESGLVPASSVDTGSPHAVTYVDDLSAVDVQKAGRALRHHPAFAPEGTNVNFVHILGNQSIQIRTYERGVEAETLACGTGSIACAVVSVIEQGLEFPVHVNVKSGEELIVHGVRDGSNIHDISLEGSAEILFKGTMLYDPSRLKIEPMERP
jgi:diaminopimelate epimerase